MTTASYVGEELELFARATSWKAYVARQVAPYLGRDVLEVGAGFGGTTRWLARGSFRRWVCLEPDDTLAARLCESVPFGAFASCCEAIAGTLEAIPPEPAFDTILYIDVLEHIEDDADELARATDRLRPGGRLVVLSPAHPWLFTPFDRALGHYRRYTKASLRAVAPPGTELTRLAYLDSVGLLASLGNRLILRSAMPSAGQIALWDKVMVRVSRLVDPLLAYSCGKSVLGVWRKA
jgi:SAM-dependent methyltransferase